MLTDFDSIKLLEYDFGTPMLYTANTGIINIIAGRYY